MQLLSSIRSTVEPFASEALKETKEIGKQVVDFTREVASTHHLAKHALTVALRVVVVAGEVFGLVPAAVSALSLSALGLVGLLGTVCLYENLAKNLWILWHWGEIAKEVSKDLEEGSIPLSTRVMGSVEAGAKAAILATNIVLIAVSVFSPLPSLFGYPALQKKIYSLLFYPSMASWLASEGCTLWERITLRHVEAAAHDLGSRMRLLCRMDAHDVDNVLNKKDILVKLAKRPIPSRRQLLVVARIRKTWKETEVHHRELFLDHFGLHIKGKIILSGSKYYPEHPLTHLLYLLNALDWFDTEWRAHWRRKRLGGVEATTPAPQGSLLTQKEHPGDPS